MKNTDRKPGAWEAMRKVTDDPKVMEALQAFAEDATEDNSVLIVEAIQQYRRRTEGEEIVLLTIELPVQLSPDTAVMVCNFAEALGKKLAKSKAKRYQQGMADEWSFPGWQTQCHYQMIQHLSKGDPLDVAAYLAFMHYHGWTTAAPIPLGWLIAQYEAQTGEKINQEGK
ncbi:hypothetical protein fHeYen801_074 [Yersinia phage fHe-Yen8-01]|nr:hypothetical protein fHeYen801_074 [Yersinia phage fHe-Yen8-01]